MDRPTSRSRPQPNIVAREIHRRRDIAARPRLHRIGAGRGRPRVQPAGNLRAAWLVAEVEWILDIRDGVDARRALGIGRAGAERGGRGDQIAADRLVQPGPTRRARPSGVAGSDTAGGGGVGRDPEQEVWLQGDDRRHPLEHVSSQHFSPLLYGLDPLGCSGCDDETEPAERLSLKFLPSGTKIIANWGIQRNLRSTRRSSPEENPGWVYALYETRIVPGAVRTLVNRR